jgi:hypothetical protein
MMGSLSLSPRPDFGKGLSGFKWRAAMTTTWPEHLSPRFATELKEVFHGGPSEVADPTSERLRCHLLVATRNLSTDSPWPVVAKRDVKVKQHFGPFLTAK